jgi:ADP-heptose:LPS heptosyltransferase
MASGWNEGFGIHPGEFSLYDYARVIKGLDLLITVDSMPAHLAGAMGVPVWTLLHSPADWRWMYNGMYSPWYPSMRLFRQPQTGDWQSVIRQVTAELENVLRQGLPLKIAA